MSGHPANWLEVGLIETIPLRGARAVELEGAEPVAVFRTGDGRIFALIDRCPHEGGPLSKGIVHGAAVACPLHGWNIGLDTGEALGADRGCTPRIDTRVENGRVFIDAAAVPLLA